MANKVLIVHGWSDNYESFRPLKQWLIMQGRESTDIFLGNYRSMQDDVTFDDLAAGMQARIEILLKDRKIDADEQDNKRLKPFSLDVIVHSTGGPVVRHWLHYYLTQIVRGAEPEQFCPIKRLIMLAPANFGSRLAAQGKTPLARLFKGGVANGFETGKLILNGLELGSPELWRMAHEDLFADRAIYPCDSKQGPFVFILSGTATYGEFKGFVAHGADEDGSDGTVRASAASLDSVKLNVDYKQSKGQLTLQRQVNKPFAFKLVEGRNHSTIVPKEPSDLANHPTLDIIRECLAIDDSNAYQQLGDKFALENDGFYTRQEALPDSSRVHAYQQFVMHLIDEMGNDVHDYRVDFHVIDGGITVNSLTPANAAKMQEFQDLTAQLRSKVIVDVETHTENSSYRTFFINIDELEALKAQIAEQTRTSGRGAFIAMNIDAVGPTADLSYNTDDLQFIPVEHVDAILPKVGAPKTATFFKANTTTLVEITISRMANEKVFEFVFDQGRATPAAEG